MNEHAVALGRKGGEAGTGKSKRRGDSDYYSALAKKGGGWPKGKKRGPRKSRLAEAGKKRWTSVISELSGEIVNTPKGRKRK